MMYYIFPQELQIHRLDSFYMEEYVMKIIFYREIIQEINSTLLFLRSGLYPHFYL